MPQLNAMYAEADKRLSRAEAYTARLEKELAACLKADKVCGEF